ncbi:hypothetical protein C8046_04880 [Serinibacter arcticus]|uniref:Uncharacterized protein n=1 Tax=Serinibacter arcticus TaxID=1655435 RepID=A0A2U1ZT16_9MICO|nr:hypothetical protein [Serinibacter arcticus]PWD50101.1 hypothetical protein C8046_04880 [Serinibacter arcticus]
MPAYSAVWVAVVAVLLAAGLLVMMMASRRPEGGYVARVRELLSSSRTATGPRTGVVAEHRDAADGDTVGLDDLFAAAESSHGYLTVPQRYETRFEELTEGLMARQRALAERVRNEREERTSA